MFQSDAVVTAAFLHVRGEEIAMDDAAVDDGTGLGFVPFCTVAADEVPASLRDVAVGAWDRRLPVFLFGRVAVNAGSFVEPVKRADDVPEADEDVWCHCLME